MRPTCHIAMCHGLGTFYIMGFESLMIVQMSFTLMYGLLNKQFKNRN